jgi:hypothetical protein
MIAVIKFDFAGRMPCGVQHPHMAKDRRWKCRAIGKLKKVQQCHGEKGLGLE